MRPSREPPSTAVALFISVVLNGFTYESEWAQTASYHSMTNVARYPTSPYAALEVFVRNRFRRYRRQSTASASLDLVLGLCTDFSDNRYFTVLSSSAPSRRGVSIEHWIDFPDKVVKTGDSYRHGWYPIFTVPPFTVELTAQIVSKEHSWIPTAYLAIVISQTRLETSSLQKSTRSHRFRAHDSFRSERQKYTDLESNNITKSYRAI